MAGGRFCILSRFGFKLSNSLAANVPYADLPIHGPSTLTILIDAESSGIRAIPSNDESETGARISPTFGFSALTVTESRHKSTCGTNRECASEYRIAAKRLAQKVLSFQ